MKKIRLWFALSAILLLLTGCDRVSVQEKAEPEPVPTESPSSAPAPAPMTEPTPEPTPEIETFYSLYGKDVSNFDEEIDLSGISIEDGAQELETMIPELTHVKKIIMSDCGLSDEEMDALNRKYEDIRFVWTIYFGKMYYLRTDETYFIASLFQGKQKYYSPLFDNDVECLKYCTDMVALDLGHMHFTNCEFAASMPHLRYLILSDTPVKDISPLAGLQELWFLEMFRCAFTDISPLLECPSLRHLNICLNKIDNPEILLQMTYLEKLWYANTYMDYADKIHFQESLPHTILYLENSGMGTAGGWRKDYAYYEMRDYFHAFYLD